MWSFFHENGKGRIIMSSAKEADVSKLANPAWLKANHQTRTELCV
jgi:hypothetical protein